MLQIYWNVHRWQEEVENIDDYSYRINTKNGIYFFTVVFKDGWRELNEHIINGKKEMKTLMFSKNIQQNITNSHVLVTKYDFFKKIPPNLQNFAIICDDGFDTCEIFKCCMKNNIIYIGSNHWYLFEIKYWKTSVEFEEVCTHLKEIVLNYTLAHKYSFTITQTMHRQKKYFGIY